jgi:Tfp pilus assembly protein PilN
MRPFLEGFVRELRFSFDYFASVVDEEPPLVFYLTGEGANLKNLDKYLSKGFNAEVALFSLPACIHSEKFKDELTPENQNKIMSASGAAARGTESINLLPQELRTKKRDLFHQVSLRMITFLLAVVFCFLLSVLDFRTRDYTKRVSYAQQQLATIREVLTVSQKDVVIERIQKEEVVVDGLLKVISASVPEEILLTEITFSKENYSLVLKGKAAAKEGGSESPLTTFMQRLEASPFFKEASLASSRTSGTTEEFDIRCDLAH